MIETKEASTEQQQRDRWQAETLSPTLARQPERKTHFQTVSLAEINQLYDPSDVTGIDFQHDVSYPGEFPYTRGIHASGYRGKWTLNENSQGASGYDDVSIAWHLALPPPLTVFTTKAKTLKLMAGTQMLLRMAEPQLPR